MSAFDRVTIGERWFCPFCGHRPLAIECRYTARCNHCRRTFRILCEMLPDPNGKVGQKECGIKIKHETPESAFQHAFEMKDLPPHRIKEKCCVYRCRYCGKWHVGHVGEKTLSKKTDFFMYEQHKERFLNVQA